MTKMTNLGVKRSDTFDRPVEVRSEKNRVDFPTLRLSKKMPDGLFAKDVGETVKLVIDAKITEKSFDEFTDKKDKSIRLEIQGMGFQTDNKLKEKISKLQ